MDGQIFISFFRQAQGSTTNSFSQVLPMGLLHTVFSSHPVLHSKIFVALVGRWKNENSCSGTKKDIGNLWYF